MQVMTAFLSCPVPKVSAVTFHKSRSHVLASYCIRSSLIAASVGKHAPLFSKHLASTVKQADAKDSDSFLPAL